MQVLNGPEIIRLREAKRWSQRDLARESGVNQRTLAAYENGKRGGPRKTRAGQPIHPAVPGRIADALGVEVDAILLKPAAVAAAVAAAAADSDEDEDAA